MKRCLILILVLLWGCSLQKGKQLPQELQNLKNVTVYSNKIKPAKSIFFQKSTVYGGTENHLIDPRGDVAVDDSGRVFIADNRETGCAKDCKIVLLNSNGLSVESEAMGFKTAYPISKKLKHSINLKGENDEICKNTNQKRDETD